MERLFEREDTMDFSWEPGFEIRTRIEDDGAMVISCNRAGLISLANHLMALAQERPGGHFHLDEHNALEEGSAELIVELVG